LGPIPEILGELRTSDCELSYMGGSPRRELVAEGSEHLDRLPAAEALNRFLLCPPLELDPD
jgi:hypothetical protein